MNSLNKYVTGIMLFIMTTFNALGNVIDLTQEEFMQKKMDSNVVVIDVRTEREYQNGHIEGAINISHSDLLKNPSLLDKFKDSDMVFYCHSGVRVGYVTSMLEQINYTDDALFHLKGDIRAWKNKGLELSK